MLRMDYHIGAGSERAEVKPAEGGYRVKKQSVIWGIQLISLLLLMVSFFFQIGAAMIAAVVLLFFCTGLSFYWRRGS